jgi:hypothetical protein
MKNEEMGGVCSTQADMRHSYTVLVWKPQRKDRWEGNIKTDLKKNRTGTEFN